MSEFGIPPFCDYPSDENECPVTTLRAQRPKLMEDGSTTMEFFLGALLAYRKLVVKAKPGQIDGKDTAAHDMYISKNCCVVVWRMEVFILHWNLAVAWTRLAMSHEKNIATTPTYLPSANPWRSKEQFKNWANSAVGDAKVASTATNDATQTYPHATAAAHAYAQAAAAVQVCQEHVYAIHKAHKQPERNKPKISAPKLLRAGSSFTSQPFLNVWKSLLLAEAQRVVVCHQAIMAMQQQVEMSNNLLLGDEDAKADFKQLAQTAGGAGALMSTVIHNCRNHPFDLQSWLRIAEGWKIIFVALSNYAAALGVDSEPQAMTVRLQCAESSLQELKNLHVLTEYQGMMKQIRPILTKLVTERLALLESSRESATFAITVVDNSATKLVYPFYYHPIDPHSGWHGRGRLTVTDDDDFIPTWPSTTPATTEEVSNNDISMALLWPSTSSSPKVELDSFTASMKKAKRQEKHVLAVIFADNVAQDRYLNEVLDESDSLVHEILAQGFVRWQANYNNVVAQLYKETNNVTQFPHVAIWEPQTATLMWRCEEWDGSKDPLYAERFAAAALECGSYNPYEGLPSIPETSPIQGDANPPTRLICTQGGFRAALDQAWATRKWVLVNLQCDSIVASHQLNRDVWHDSVIEDMVREGFVFWQKVCI